MRKRIFAYVRDKYGITPLYPWKMQPGYAVFCHRHSLKWFAMLMNVEGSRIGLAPGRMYDVINLRVPERDVPRLLARRGFLPAYHMAAREWVTIVLGDDISAAELFEMIDRSFALTGERADRQFRQDGGQTPRQNSRRSSGEGEIRFGRRYKDRPLPASAWGREENLPQKIREMKTLARPGRGMLEENIFYQQARYMAEYEDDYRYKGRFVRFYPTYQGMTGEQLRGYFGWRTRCRRGEAVLEQVSYVYLYLYELLCGADGKSPEETFEKIQQVMRDFGEPDEALREKIRLWSHDYVIYHGLDLSLLEESGRDQSEALAVLLRYEGILRREKLPAAAGDAALTEGAAPEGVLAPAGNVISSEGAAPEGALAPAVEEVFAALCRASSYDLTSSAFYKKYPEETCGGAVRAYRQLCLARKDRKMTLLKKYFGPFSLYPYQMFAGAVFYDPRRKEDRICRIHDALWYECRNGNWYCHSFTKTKERSRELGNICHEIDRQLRLQFGFKSVLKPRLEEKAAAGLIEQAIREWREECRKAQEEIRADQEEAMRPELVIDFSLLDRIRKDAEHTRDQLLTEEEAGTGAAPEDEMDQIEEAGEPDAREGEAAAAEDPGMAAGGAAADTVRETELPETLNRQQAAFLRLLLAGEDWRAFVREEHLMLSLLVDEINEAFYGEIGDTVLEFDGETPVPVEEYEEELRGYV